MLKRLFGRDRGPKPSAAARQTIARPRRGREVSRWAAVMPELGRRVRVTRIERETPDAVSVVLAPLDGKPLSFRAGQYLTHCLDVDGQQLRRAYSLSVAPGGELCFTCKRVEGGRVSAFICDQLDVGAEYEVRGPSGDFVLAEGDAPLLMVAGGSGITPVISLIESALAENPQRRIELIYASRDEDAIIFAPRLERLGAAHDGLGVTHVLSQAGPGWPGERGRLDAERLRSLVQIGPDTQAYLCGPDGLMQAAREALQAAGVTAGNIHQEQFLSVNHADIAHPTEPQTIVFSRSGASVEQAPGQSILDAALSQGVTVDFSCTVGGCAACKIKVVKGRTAQDEPNCLSEAERADGYVLACSAYALETLEVEA